MTVVAGDLVNGGCAGGCPQCHVRGMTAGTGGIADYDGIAWTRRRRIRGVGNSHGVVMDCIKIVIITTPG